MWYLCCIKKHTFCNSIFLDLIIFISAIEAKWQRRLCFGSLIAVTWITLKDINRFWWNFFLGICCGWRRVMMGLDFVWITDHSLAAVFTGRGLLSNWSGIFYCIKKPVVLSSLHSPGAIRYFGRGLRCLIVSNQCCRNVCSKRWWWWWWWWGRWIRLTTDSGVSSRLIGFVHVWQFATGADLCC